MTAKPPQKKTTGVLQPSNLYCSPAQVLSMGMGICQIAATHRFDEFRALGRDLVEPNVLVLEHPGHLDVVDSLYPAERSRHRPAACTVVHQGGSSLGVLLLDSGRIQWRGHQQGDFHMVIQLRSNTTIRMILDIPDSFLGIAKINKFPSLPLRR